MTLHSRIGLLLLLLVTLVVPMCSSPPRVEAAPAVRDGRVQDGLSAFRAGEPTVGAGPPSRSGTGHAAAVAPEGRISGARPSTPPERPVPTGPSERSLSAAPTTWTVSQTARPVLVVGLQVFPPVVGVGPGRPAGDAVGTGTARAGPRSAEAPTSRRFRLPLPPPPVVLTPFRAPAHRYGPGHRGVDLAGSTGAAVDTAGAGTVVYAGRLAGRGVVSVQHSGGLRTTYEPVTATVHAGEAVTAGQLIGRLEAGHPPCGTASCLHWGARLPDGSYLDPMTLLTGLHVRLKPWVSG
ncbi:M23 family metallopeptidase [Nakamurella endophytica]|uniref:M23ase beta-sheet core domain-containing protein n=1 Tax=Nakamurella endophytica TaxID=1748367 RepID=A0A917SND5_9ACTN|nr:M23 family metallopeptidase [Nakamurella endophytica]GGL90493.1 hypothetical protein GCM10011594_07670 [Nakamurella endophytica]